MSRLEELGTAAKQYNDLHNEGQEGYNPFDAKIDEELDRMMAGKEVAFKAEWTQEVTAERRAAWNIEATATPIKSGADLRAAEATVGFTMDDLKKAVAIHAIGTP